jgi:uncharacterized membrane protein YkvA (DUF1232 family)
MKFLRDIAHNLRVHGHAVWLCARDRELGAGPRLLALIIAGYALSPIDLIPDFIPVIGLLDDALLIPLGLWLLRRMIPDAIYARNFARAEMASQRPVSRVAVGVILMIWLAATAAVLSWWTGYRVSHYGW